MAEPMPMPPLVPLGEAIRALRSQRGISQEALGLTTGVHRNYIGGVERGERNPSVATVIRLADALGVRAWELLKLADEMPSEPTFVRRAK